MRKIVASLELSLNEEKTQIVKPGDDVELLGIEIRAGGFDVADNTMAKARTKLTHYANKLVRREQRKEMTKEVAVRCMARRIEKYFNGTDEGSHELCWKDFFFHVLTRVDSLYEIDHMRRDLLRYVATGSTAPSANGGCQSGTPLTERAYSGWKYCANGKPVCSPCS